MASPLQPGLVIEALNVLTSPSALREHNQHSFHKDESFTPFERMLLENVDHFATQLDTDPHWQQLKELWIQDSDVVVSDESVRWKFVTYCLKILNLLQKSIKISMDVYKSKEHNPVKPSSAPVMSPDTLSFNKLKIFKTGLQFVVCLGILPNLRQGVGIPIELRSGFSEMAKSSENEKPVSDLQGCEKIFICLKVLIGCVFNPSLGTTVLTQHLTDILAGLFQLIYTRKSDKPQQTVASDTPQANSDKLKPEVTKSCDKIKIDNSDTFKDQGKKETCKENQACDISLPTENVPNTGTPGDIVDIAYCQKVLDDLLQKMYPPLLVKTLLLLQGGPKTKSPGSSKGISPPAPVWLRRACGQQLTAIMMKPQGVLSILRGMLDGPGAGQGMSGASDWRKCDAVAKVIAHCPQQAQSAEAYYQKAAPQILQLLYIQDKQLSREFIRVACSTISNMVTQHRDLAKKYLIFPLLKPLVSCVEWADIPETEGVIVEEDKISQCIDTCHKVFVCGSTSHPELITTLQPVILVLYNILVFTKTGVSALRKTVQELIVAFLRESELPVSLTCLQLITFNTSQSELAKEFPRMHCCLTFVHGSSGGVQVVATTTAKDASPDQSVTVECIVSLLKDLEKSELPAEFIVYMLHELTELIRKETQCDMDASSTHPPTSSTDSQALLDLEQQNQSRVDQLYRKLMLLNVLASICEELGETCIKNVQHTLEFVKATLERGIYVCKATGDESMATFESETLTMGMGMLTAVLTGAFEKLTVTDRKKMEELLPLLSEISDHHPDSTVHEMAADIRIAIATHGAVWSESTKSKGKDFSQMSQKIKSEQVKVFKDKQEINTAEKMHPKIEVISTDDRNQTKLETNNSKEYEKQTDVKSAQGDLSNDAISGISGLELNENKMSDEKPKMECKTDKSADENHRHFEPSSTQYIRSETAKTSIENSESETKSISEVDKAYEELCDPLLPVRGHGLIRLTQAVKSRDPAVGARRDGIIKIFEENLDHPDSYLYLSAVNGLSALCDVYPEIILPKICAQFTSLGQTGDGRKRSTELRMKLGEVIVKATRCLGELVPKYKDLLIRTVLVGTRDQEPFVRASSLSNLGDICKLLRFSLGNIVQEVFVCCSSLLKSDPDAEVRKAAGQAIVLLLQGMGDDVTKILGPVLKDLYRLLKQVLISEKDEKVKFHAHMALEELDIIMKRQLFPEQKLEKKIRVRDYD